MFPGTLVFKFLSFYRFCGSVAASHIWHVATVLGSSPPLGALANMWRRLTLDFLIQSCYRIYSRGNARQKRALYDRPRDSRPRVAVPLKRPAFVMREACSVSESSGFRWKDLDISPKCRGRDDGTPAAQAAGALRTLGIARRELGKSIRWMNSRNPRRKCSVRVRSLI